MIIQIIYMFVLTPTYSSVHPTLIVDLCTHEPAVPGCSSDLLCSQLGDEGLDDSILMQARRVPAILVLKIC